MKANSKGLPKLQSKLKRGEIVTAPTVFCWLVIKWMDTKDVHVITTVLEIEFRATGKKKYHTQKNVIKTSCVIDYNRNMGGTDSIDRKLSLTERIRKSMKWYMKLFLHLMDLPLTAAHAVYKMKNEYISFPVFRIKVVRSFLEKNHAKAIPRSSDTSWLHNVFAVPYAH